MVFGNDLECILSITNNEYVQVRMIVLDVDICKYRGYVSLSESF